MKNKTITLLKFIIGWPLSLVAFAFLFRFFSPELVQIQQKIIHANIFLFFLSILFFQCYFFIRVLLWKAILATRGHAVPLRPTAWYWSIAEINRYIPGNVWSIIGRGAVFGKFGIKQTTLLFAWSQESLLLFLGSVLAGLYGIVLIFSRILPAFWLKNGIFWITIVMVFAASLGYVMQRYLGNFSFFPKKFNHLLTSPLQSLNLIALSFLSFIFFGLGTYVGISSITLLPLQDMGQLIGLFAVSFLAGYASLITPMGLGVRELVMSQGLLPFVSRALVGFLSIYARFLLIVSELLFLCIAFLFHKIRKSIHVPYIQHIKSHKYAYMLSLSIALYVFYFTLSSFLKYTNFYTGRFDLGNMDQTVWNTLHGKIFQLTDPNGTNIMSRLGTHADFILILLAPFYLLWQDPRMLLFLQSFILGIGAFFVYDISKNVLKDKTFAIVLSLAYLISPSVENSNLYDFHAVTFATTFFLAAWYFLKKRKILWTLFFLLLASLTKEEAWIVTGFFGLYYFFFEKKRMLGFLVATFSFGAFYALVWKLIPLARGGQHFALSYYADFGSTPGGIVKSILSSPLKILKIIFSWSRITYMVQLLFPVGFLALLAPQFLIFALPDLGINLLSTNTQLQQIYYQYTAVITPFIFIATIYGVQNLRKKLSLPISFFSYALIVTTLISAFLFGPLPGSMHPDVDMFTKPQPSSTIIENFLLDIPDSFSVAATNNLGSHLSHRQKIFTVPVGMDKADVVVFLLNDDFAQPSLAAQKAMAESMKHDKNYVEVMRLGDFVAFERRDLYARKEPVLQKNKLYPASIETLQERDFEGGTIHIERSLGQTDGVESVLFSYPSDGLKLFGRIDMPQDKSKTYPVVIINRGYIKSSVFQEETAYQNIARAFVKKGFIAITPDYRNNGESDKDTNIAGVITYPIDVLNLLNSLPTFPQANSKHVFLWGFSVGGQITLTTLAVYGVNTNIIPTIQAASVWTPVDDPYTGYLRFHELFPTQAVPYQRVMNTFGMLEKNTLAWESISPLFYIQDIKTPIRIVDALADTITPYEWSIELYDNLVYYHKSVRLSLYNTDHNFTNTWETVVAEDISYFNSYLH